MTCRIVGLRQARYGTGSMNIIATVTEVNIRLSTGCVCPEGSQACRYISDLNSSEGKKIAAGRMSCINTGGIAYGTAVQKKVNVPKGQVQALWCGIDVPKDAGAGDYLGEVTVGSEGQQQVIHMRIKVGTAIGMTTGKYDPSQMAQFHPGAI